jgi:hypothetical protein
MRLVSMLRRGPAIAGGKKRRWALGSMLVALMTVLAATGLAEMRWRSFGWKPLCEMGDDWEGAAREAVRALLALAERAP